MNTLYVFPDGSKLYAPDQPVPKWLADSLRHDLAGYLPPRGFRVLDEPVEIVDLRDPEPTFSVVEIPAA